MKLVPKELETLIDSGLTLKTSNTTTQVAYFNCYLAALTAADVKDRPKFVKVLEDHMKTSQSKSAAAANYPLYLVATCVLFKLASRVKPSEYHECKGMRLTPWFAPGHFSSHESFVDCELYSTILIVFQMTKR